MKFDLRKNEAYPEFGSKKKVYNHLTDEMKKTLVQECVKCGSQRDFYNKVFHNYVELHIAEAQNKTDAWDVIRHDYRKNQKRIPIYKWMVEPIIVNKELTLGQEMLNFIYWLNKKNVEIYNLCG